jgi:hypothetical protein
MPTYAYTFTGPEPEDFPAPPLARRLEPGDVVELPEPVEHARLEPTDETRKQLAKEQKAAARAVSADSAAEPPPASPAKE